MPVVVTIKKVKSGGPSPGGKYVLLRKTRSSDIYQVKTTVVSMDELSSLMSGIFFSDNARADAALNAMAVERPDEEVDHLADLLMNTKLRGSRRHRKTRRTKKVSRR